MPKEPRQGPAVLGRVHRRLAHGPVGRSSFSTLLNTYPKQVHPRLVHFGSINIPTYGAVAAVGIVVSLLFALRCARIAHVSEDGVWNLGLFTAFSTLVLSRLILVAGAPRAFLTYPLLILSLPTVTRWGMLFAALSGLAYIAAKRLPLLRTLDAIAAPASLLSAFLHLGSIFAGDDLGTATTSRLGWLIPGDEGHHPVALYATVAAVCVSAVSFGLLRTQRQHGEAFGGALALSAAARFLIDELRPLYLLPSTALDAALRLDQLLLLALGVAGALFFLQRKPSDAQ